MRVGLTTLAAAVALLVPAAASGSGPNAHMPILGVVPHSGVAVPAHGAAHSHAARFATTCGSSCASYESAINQYFTDVAAASGTTTNVYSTDRQYWDATGAIAYTSAFGGSYVDTNGFPASGCDDGVDAVCLTDQQLQDEIQHVLTTKGWHGSTTNLFFIMTPDGVGSCADASGSECTTNVFCAYHSGFFDSNNEPVLYGNEPFDKTIPLCWDGTSPNASDADPTINTISHEHNEAITDPTGTAWLDSLGEENGDLCAWDFGSELGGTPGVDAWNQVINGHHYWLQQEWSNIDNGCVQNYTAATQSPANGDTLELQTQPCNMAVQCWVMRTNTVYAIYWMPAPPANSGAPVISGSAGVGQVLHTSPGGWTNAPSGFAYQWQRCASNGTGCAAIPGATTSNYTLIAADNGHVVRSTVSAHNSAGSSAYAASNPTAVVVLLPAATAAPVVSGIPAVGKTFSTTNGTWNVAAAFKYQWQRCTAGGTGCSAISGATMSTYLAVAADAGHSLKAVVSATNAAGTASFSSAATPEVVALPAATGAPRISGKAKVGHRLSATRGNWTWSPTAYHFQWLRCSRSGSKCAPIQRATRANYKLGKKDAGHRLLVSVTAVNAAGSHTASSRTTKTVHR